MSAICSTTCGTSTLAQQYFNCVDVFRKSGANEFILMSCSWVPADVTSATDWETAVTANEVHISPPGKLIIQPPTFDLIEIEGCGREVPGELSTLIDFETYQTQEDLSDCDYWSDLFTNFASYRIAFVDCNNSFKLSKAYTDAIKAGNTTVAGSSPGFVFSVTIPPHELEGDGDYVKWQTQFKIKTTGVLCSVALPGVRSALA